MIINDNDLGPLPIAHPRSIIMYEAENVLRDYISEFRKQFKLTPSEEMKLLSDSIGRISEMCIVSERRK